MNVLSIDDSSTVRKIIKAVCDVLEYNFFESENGSDALDFLKTGAENIDLILLDWNMPGLSGFEVLEALKTDEALRHIPVMMVTTESEKNSIVAAIKAGAINYMKKPFSVEDLMTKMLECVGENNE